MACTTAERNAMRKRARSVATFGQARVHLPNNPITISDLLKEFESILGIVLFHSSGRWRPHVGLSDRERFHYSNKRTGLIANFIGTSGTHQSIR